MSAPRQPDDVDPTGIRDLLASLPDPGPMPEDLVARIEARLEVERAHRAGGAPLDPSSGATVARAADDVFDLAAERSHRRPARTVAVLGAAAAGLLVTTVAVTQLIGSDGGFTADTAAVYPSLTRGDDAARGAAEEGADAGADLAEDEGGALAGEGDDEAAEAGSDTGGDDAAEAGDGESAPSLDAQDDAASGDAAQGDEALEDVAWLGAVLSSPDPELGGRLSVLPHLGTVVEADLVDALRTALRADVNSYGSQDLTLEEARSCWQVLPAERGFGDYVAAPTDLGSSASPRAAVALLGVHDDGTGEVWVLPESCTDGARVTPLTGPHELEAFSPR